MQSVSYLHKVVIEDDSEHAQSFVWSVSLKGYLNSLEQSGDIVGHGDALPPVSATDPPVRAAVIVEKLDGGAGQAAQPRSCTAMQL